MKAIQLQKPGGLDQLRLVELPMPGTPQPGEIQVRIHASSLNYHDLGVVIGQLKVDDLRIPMADGAGVVTAVGAGVTEFAVGDAVVSCFFPHWQAGRNVPSTFKTVPGDGVDGFAREYVNMPAQAFTHSPKGYSHEQAATLTTAGLTAWRALMSDDHLKPGDTVLVQGTGGVSIFALQFAKLAGATVIATSSSDAKLERLKALGADHLINYKATPAWGEKVRELTDNRGVDHVIEVGGPATLEQSMIAARIGGHVSLIGILTGVAGQLPLVQALVRQIRLQGVLVGNRAQQQAMVRAIDANGLRPVVDKHFELEQIVEAFRYQESNRHFGKICLTW